MKIEPHLIQIWLLGAALLQATIGDAQVTVTQIAAGTQDNLFVKSDGSLWGMGWNYYGQLGDGLGDYSTNQPEMIVPNGVTAVAARGLHSFFQIGSSFSAMGDNSYGELGDGTTNNIYVPKQITTGITLATGYSHTLFTRSSINVRDLDVMGDNEIGELGDGTSTGTNTPERIERDSTVSIGSYYVTAVAAGDEDSFFIKSDGSLWGMGGNFRGQFGDGTYNNTNRAEKIVSSGVIAVAAGEDHTLFLTNGGSLWAMGDNTAGELGNTSVVTGTGHDYTNRPVLVVASGVTAIAAGYYDSFFIKSDGSLWAMGYNYSGELGDGTLNNTNKPEQIVAGGVTAVAAGDNHTLFLISDGSLWGMGDNIVGELGTSPATYLALPVQIVGPMVGNGGFETHDFLGWTRSGNLTDSSVDMNFEYAHSGTYGARMGPPTSPGFLSQTLNTTAGTNYLLSFWLNCDGETPNEFSVSWNGTTLVDQVNIGAIGWTNMQFTVMATSANTALQFGFRDDPSYLGFDDVSVVPVSQPTITGISLAGMNLVLNATNGLWSGIYVTLMSTNLAQPLHLWMPVATNTLDGSGSFTITVTNAVDWTAPQRFYTLQLQ